MFFKGSRYANVPTLEIADEEGRARRYKALRFIPDTPARLGHKLADEERLDHVAHRYYADAERFWRICDANLATWPGDLESGPGRILLIPPAEG